MRGGIGLEKKGLVSSCAVAIGIGFAFASPRMSRLYFPHIVIYTTVVGLRDAIDRGGGGVWGISLLRRGKRTARMRIVLIASLSVSV
jgi:hypothetical protein